MGAIRSGSILFAIKAIKVHKQMKEQMTFIMYSGKMVPAVGEQLPYNLDKVQKQHYTCTFPAVKSMRL